MSEHKVGLALSGGGARGAYQAGVLKAISEILDTKKNPFPLVAGVSAGSINAGALAAFSDNFEIATQQLCKLWGQLTADKVFRTDLRSLGTMGVKWMKDLSFGGVLGGGGQSSLLDTAPLRDLLRASISFSKIEENINNGHLEALAITAANVYSTNSVTFVQAKAGIPLWARYRRSSEAAEITVDHIMASSAIPIFFPSVEINGRHFIDGCIRNAAPISPVVHMGADKVLAIGVRKHQDIGEATLGPRERPTTARIIGFLMNAVFMDSIEADVERLKRVNQMTTMLPKEVQETYHWQPMDLLYISPSEDLGHLANEYSKSIPRTVRYLMKGLGDTGSTEDIASYLLFDKSYCSHLIEIGYRDGMAHRQQVLELFSKTE